MIRLDITEESGSSFYELLGLTREQVAKAAKPKRLISDAATKACTLYHTQAQRGDKEAEEKESRVNEAAAILKDEKKRDDYNKELDSGKGATLEVLRTRPVAPPVYRERPARFRVIEALMRSAGLTRPIWEG